VHYFAHGDPAARTFPFARVPAGEVHAVLKRKTAGGSEDVNNLPVLLSNDFMYRYLALRAGEVVRIERENAKRGREDFYRVAAPAL
jgi:DNA-directed RNA polymerase subunit H (RpoH/RPB5)